MRACYSRKAGMPAAGPVTNVPDSERLLGTPRVRQAPAARKMGGRQGRGRIATNALAACLTRLGNRPKERQQDRFFLIEISVVPRLALRFLFAAQFVKMKIIPQ